MTTNSCQLFGFARDSGVPFSKSPSQVSHVYQTQRGQASNTATSLRFRVPLIIFLLLLSLGPWFRDRLPAGAGPRNFRHVDDIHDLNLMCCVEEGPWSALAAIDIQPGKMGTAP